jgi:dTDP-4-dehydrorhamnose 3,5-epimerase
VKFLPCDVTDAWVIDPAPHIDERGRFMRAWCDREFADQGIDFTPRQANLIHSVRAGTVRGLHFQVAPALEAKLVRCTRGALFDVVVDLRLSSPTYRRWYGVELNPDNARMLLVPEGCAHGCQSLVDDTEILYMASAYFAPEHARGLHHADPAFGIRWPLEATALSVQDRDWPRLADVEAELATAGAKCLATQGEP